MLVSLCVFFHFSIVLIEKYFDYIDFSFICLLSPTLVFVYTNILFLYTIFLRLFLIFKLCLTRVCHYHCGLIRYFYEIPEIRSVWHSMLCRDGKYITQSYFTVSQFEHCTVALTPTTCLFGVALMNLVMQLFKAIALNFVNKDSDDSLIIQLKYVVHRKHIVPNACEKYLSGPRVRFIQVNESCL